MAAITGKKASRLGNRLIGDGIVPLASALGRHPNPRLALKFDESRQWIAHGTNHFDLPTAYFATPVGRVQLRPAEGGAELLIDLRARARSLASLHRTPRGMVLRVDFRPAEVPPPEAPADTPPSETAAP